MSDEERILKWLRRIWHELGELLEHEVHPRYTLTLTTKEGLMANYQLNAGDSVVVTIADTDTVTGLAVTPDAGSVTAVLSSTTDTIVVDPSGTFVTITSGSTLTTGNTVTVNATVGGVASTPAVGTYDVVAAVVPANPTALSVTFGTETAPAPAAAVLPAGTTVDAAGVTHSA